MSEETELAWIKALDSETSETLYALAYQAYEHGRYEDALKLFRFLTLHCSSKRHWMGLGATLQVLKQYEEALSCYGLAALEDASDPYVHLHAADCLFALDNIPGALIALEASENAATNKGTFEELLKRVKLMRAAWETTETKGSKRCV